MLSDIAFFHCWWQLVLKIIKNIYSLQTGFLGMLEKTSIIKKCENFQKGPFWKGVNKAKWPILGLNLKKTNTEKIKACLHVTKPHHRLSK